MNSGYYSDNTFKQFNPAYSSPYSGSSSYNYGYGSNPSKEFLESNSLVAKLSFLIFVVVVFAILLRLGISLITYFMVKSDSPRLIDGMVDAKHALTIPQDPSTSGAKTVGRSQNASDGIEFTWSVWINIDDLTYNTGKYKCVFYKGNDNIGTTGLNFPNNAPGLYIAPNSNKLVVLMNTYTVINEEIIIPDIPLNKWLNIIIRCQNTDLDIYVNGVIAKSHKLHGVPKQNYGDVYVAMNGGFSGYIADLWYYNHALGISDIQRIANKGPNMTLVGSKNSSLLLPKDNNFLSLKWYFSGSGDAFNPTVASTQPTGASV